MNIKIGYFVSEFPYLNKEGKEIHFENYSYGGSVEAAYNLAVNLANRGIKIDVFTRSRSSKDSCEAHGRISIHRYGTIFDIFNQPIPLNMIFKPLFKNVDIIHMHTGGHPLTHLSTILYKKIRDKSLVVTYHGDFYSWGGFFMKTLNNFYNNLQDKLLSNADIIISVSKNYINESPILKKYKNKIIVIPNGINAEKFDIPYTKEECRKKLGLPLDKKLILFLSGIRETKAPDLLIEVMPRIVKNIPEANLILVGKGRMEDKVKHLAKELGVDNLVSFPGFIGDTFKKALYYKSSDVFVLPSMLESFGIVNLEAMACSVPIVASKIGGVPDVVKDGENGLLVPPKDSDALADAIIYLLENEDVREKMGKNGREKVEDYSWERIAEETGKVYENLMR